MASSALMQRDGLQSGRRRTIVMYVFSRSVITWYQFAYSTRVTNSAVPSTQREQAVVVTASFAQLLKRSFVS